MSGIDVSLGLQSPQNKTISAVKMFTGQPVAGARTKNVSKNNSAMQGQASTEDSALNISGEAMKLYQENQEKLQDYYARQAEERETQSLEEQKKAADEAAASFKELTKIMEIARRISNGDKVPGSDEKKLMEFSSDLYQAAKAAAFINANKKHKEYDSVYDEDEENEDQSSSEDPAGNSTSVDEQIERILKTTDMQLPSEGASESAPEVDSGDTAI